jgi:predicted dehydrogenase
VDGIFLEINDPALHWEYFRMAAEAGKPIFIDKPLAASLADARKIVRLAEKKNLKAWTASSLRYDSNMAAACEQAGKPFMCSIYGAMGIAAAGSSLIWYGIHEFEMLNRIMGTGAARVRAAEDSRGIVSVVEFKDGRRAVVESNTKSYIYGGRVQSADNVFPFRVDSSRLYYSLMTRIRAFMVKGEIPVKLRDSLEIQAVMDAAERSVRSGRRETVRATTG